MFRLLALSCLMLFEPKAVEFLHGNSFLSLLATFFDHKDILV